MYFSVFLLQFAEKLLNGSLTPAQEHVPYFRWYIAYKLYTMGKRENKEDQSVCDIQYRISERKQKQDSWIQCESPMCGRWLHKYCVELREN